MDDGKEITIYPLQKRHFCWFSQKSNANRHLKSEHIRIWKIVIYNWSQGVSEKRKCKTGICKIIIYHKKRRFAVNFTAKRSALYFVETVRLLDLR